MNVLIIPEDFRKDQHIIKPILRKLFEYIGKPKAKVEVCIDPLLGGVGEALKWERLQDVIEMNPMVNLFLLVVDRDGNEHRRQALDNLETKAEKMIGTSRSMIAENAWQEVEVWALAAIEKLPKNWTWAAIRQEPNPKELYFLEVARDRNLTHHPDQGRSILGKEAAANYKRVRSRCKEDLQSLEERIREFAAPAK